MDLDQAVDQVAVVEAAQVQAAVEAAAQAVAELEQELALAREELAVLQARAQAAVQG